jgi:phospholipid transport system substrate-binding protein
MASNNTAQHGPRDRKSTRLYRSLQARRMVGRALRFQHLALKTVAVTGLVVMMGLATSGSARAFAPDQPVESFAGKFVVSVIYKGMALFEDPVLTPVERERRFTQLIGQNLDIQKIARFTLGRYWNRATEKERQDFVEVLPGYLGQAFGGRISQFAGALVQVVRTSRVDNDIHVVTRIYFMGQRPSAASTSEFEVGWLVGQTAGGFRIEDLDIEGTSLELVERTDVTSLIERSGASVAGAVTDMRQSLGQTLAGP